MLRVLALLVIVLSVPADAQPVVTGLPFRVVVHRTSRVESLSRAEISAIFLRRTRSWSPIDQPPTARIRDRFSNAIHGKSVPYVVRYWQRLIFAGRAIPPAEGKSDAAVLDFIRRNPDAIGYVALATPLGDDVKAIAVTR
jgi:ABC-type phosphate transport system substrate-binding protein